MRPVIFRSTKFWQGLPNFKDAVVLPRRQIFVRREIWQICQFTRHDLKENVNQGKLISIFSRSISVRSPPKLLHIKYEISLAGKFYAAIKRWRWKICTSVCCMTILTQNTASTVPKFASQLRLPGQVLFNLYFPMRTDQIHISMQTTWVIVSRVHVQILVLKKILLCLSASPGGGGGELPAEKLSGLPYLWPRSAFGAANTSIAHLWEYPPPPPPPSDRDTFFEIFGRAKQMLSVKYAQTQSYALA